MYMPHINNTELFNSHLNIKDVQVSYFMSDIRTTKL